MVIFVCSRRRDACLRKKKWGRKNRLSLDSVSRVQSADMCVLEAEFGHALSQLPFDDPSVQILLQSATQIATDSEDSSNAEADEAYAALETLEDSQLDVSTIEQLLSMKRASVPPTDTRLDLVQDTHTPDSSERDACDAVYESPLSSPCAARDSPTVDLSLPPDNLVDLFAFSPCSDDDKIDQRKKQNRASAHRSRLRKRAYIESLQAEVAYLRVRCNTLSEENASLVRTRARHE